MPSRFLPRLALALAVCAATPSLAQSSTNGAAQAESATSSTEATDAQRRAFGQWAVTHDQLLSRALNAFELTRRRMVEISTSGGDLNELDRIALRAAGELEAVERDYRAVPVPSFPELELGSGAEPAQQAASALASIGHLREAVRMFPVMARAEREGNEVELRRSMRAMLRANRALIEVQMSGARNLVGSAVPESVDLYMQRLELHFYASLLAIASIQETRLLGEAVTSETEPRRLAQIITEIETDVAALQVALRAGKANRDSSGDPNAALLDRVDALSASLVRIWTAHATDLRAMDNQLLPRNYDVRQFGALMDRIRATREAVDTIYRQQNEAIAGS